MVAEIEAAAELAVAVEADQPTTKIKIKLNLQIINLTRKDQNTLTYLPVLGGPVLSTGRKAARLLIVATPSSASGRTSWPHAPEPLASLASMYNPALKI